MAVVRDAGWVVALDLVAAWLVAAAAIAGPSPQGARGAVPRRRRRAGARSASAEEHGPDHRRRDDRRLPRLRVRRPLLAGRRRVRGAREPDSASGVRLACSPATVTFVARRVRGDRTRAGRTTRRRAPAVLSRSERLSPWEWALPLVLLDALFLAFVAVQIFVLFGGHDHVLRTAGLTYAEYAHQGFWQLVAVAVLTLAVVMTAVHAAATPQPCAPAAAARTPRTPLRAHARDRRVGARTAGGLRGRRSGSPGCGSSWTSSRCGSARSSSR